MTMTMTMTSRVVGENEDGNNHHHHHHHHHHHSSHQHEEIGKRSACCGSQEDTVVVRPDDPTISPREQHPQPQQSYAPEKQQQQQQHSPQSDDPHEPNFTKQNQQQQRRLLRSKRKPSSVVTFVRVPLLFRWLLLPTILVGCSFFQSLLLCEAKCVVKNRHGQELDLNVLPFGMQYSSNGKEDALHCEMPGACREHTITGCTMVRCFHDYACQQSRFDNNQWVVCAGYHSCTDAVMTEGQEVRCGDAMEKHRPPRNDEKPTIFCKRTVLQVHDLLSCLGSGSCAMPDYDNHMVVNVGRSGTIQCGFAGQYVACENMIVQVSHGNRACYAEQADLINKNSQPVDEHGNPIYNSDGEVDRQYQKCAIYCDTEKDCDKTTIQFQVLEQNTADADRKQKNADPKQKTKQEQP